MRGRSRRVSAAARQRWRVCTRSRRLRRTVLRKHHQRIRSTLIVIFVNDPGRRTRRDIRRRRLRRTTAGATRARCILPVLGRERPHLVKTIRVWPLILPAWYPFSLPLDPITTRGGATHTLRVRILFLHRLGLPLALRITRRRRLWRPCHAATAGMQRNARWCVWRGRNRTGIPPRLFDRPFASVDTSRIVPQGPTFMWRRLRGRRPWIRRTTGRL